MDGNTTISVALLISVASIVFTALNYRRNAKKDDEEHQREKEKQVENRLKMNMKLDQLCNTTNEIRLSLIHISEPRDGATSRMPSSA